MTDREGSFRVHDAVVVGGGAAGLAAATWIARYRRSVVVLDSAEQRNRWVDLAHGYLGEDPVHPGELLERARQQLTKYAEAALCAGQASSVRQGEDGVFVLDAGDGLRLRSLRLVLATGVVDRFPEVENFFEHYGASVFHCPTCDGYEARDTRVVVFGWSEDVTGFALTLRGWARSVTIVTDGRPFEGDATCRRQLDEAGISVLEDDAAELPFRRTSTRCAGGWRTLPTRVTTNSSRRARPEPASRWTTPAPRPADTPQPVPKRISGSVFVAGRGRACISLSRPPGSPRTGKSAHQRAFPVRARPAPTP